MTTRRDFLRGLGAVAISVRASPWGAPERGGRIQFGYAAITWGDDDLRAIEDISAVGFRAIQLRSNVLDRYGDRPAALAELLAQHRLTLVALSSGAVRIDSANHDTVMETHVRHAKFVHDVGGLYLQVTDERPRNQLASDYARLGRLLTEIGKRTLDLGVPLGYHNHMGTLGEKPSEVDEILTAADPRYVKLLLDVAHFRAADGDSVAAIHKYRERLLFLHIKDVQIAPQEGDAPRSRQYRFVELGRGQVDLKGTFTALREIDFSGWAVIELDSVPEKSRTPKEYAILNRRYVEEQIGLPIG